MNTPGALLHRQWDRRVRGAAFPRYGGRSSAFDGSAQGTNTPGSVCARSRRPTVWAVGRTSAFGRRRRGFGRQHRAVKSRAPTKALELVDDRVEERPRPPRYVDLLQ